MIPSRVNRVSETLKEVLSEIIQRDLKDPHVGFVTVTGVKMSPDLKQARVWVSVMGDAQEEKDTIAALTHAKGFLKAEVAKRVRLRYMPEITFVPDETVNTSMRIEGILKEILPEKETKMGKKTDQTSKAVIEALEVEAVVCLSSHEHADGDSLGSLLGLALVLRDRGSEVLPALPRDAEVPPQYSFLPGQEMLVPMADLPPEPALFMALDCGNLTRLDGLQDKAKAAAVLVNIDHHEDNTAFGKHNLVDMFASSTSELAFRLVRDAGWEISPEAAKCFYTGLVTDTGRFRHQNTSSEAMRAAADLVDLGAEPAEVVNQIYEKVSLPYLRLTGMVLERTRLHGAFPLVYSYLTQDDLKRTGVEMGETEDLIDHLRVAGDADAVLLLKEQADGQVRASLRSRDDISVGLVARAFGGGGHARAAGFTADATVEEVVEMVVKAILEQHPGTGAA